MKILKFNNKIIRVPSGQIGVKPPVKPLKFLVDTTYDANPSDFLIQINNTYTVKWDNNEQTFTGPTNISFQTAGQNIVEIYGNELEISFAVEAEQANKLLEIQQWGDSKITGPQCFKSCHNLTITAIDAATLYGNCSQMFIDNFFLTDNVYFNDWDVSQVTNMSRMFESAQITGAGIYSAWDTGNVTNMSYMFNGCNNFNADISTWNTSNVLNMDYMFNSASSFNQDLSGWCVSLISSKPTGFDSGATSWTLPKPVWGTCP